jgi:hypothetical protein
MKKRKNVWVALHYFAQKYGDPKVKDDIFDPSVYRSVPPSRSSLETRKTLYLIL